MCGWIPYSRLELTDNWVACTPVRLYTAYMKNDFPKKLLIICSDLFKYLMRLAWYVVIMLVLTTVAYVLIFLVLQGIIPKDLGLIILIIKNLVLIPHNLAVLLVCASLLAYISDWGNIPWLKDYIGDQNPNMGINQEHRSFIKTLPKISKLMKPGRLSVLSIIVTIFLFIIPFQLDVSEKEISKMCEKISIDMINEYSNKIKDAHVEYAYIEAVCNQSVKETFNMLGKKSNISVQDNLRLFQKDKIYIVEDVIKLRTSAKINLLTNEVFCEKWTKILKELDTDNESTVEECLQNFKEF